MCVMGCFYRPKWAKSPLPEAIRGKNWAMLPATAVMCRKNCTEFGCDQPCAVGFNENFGLFEVPCTRACSQLSNQQYAEWKSR